VSITKQQVKEGFANEQLLVFDDSLEMQDYLRSLEWNNKNLLMMSSGNYDGLNIKEFSTQLMNKK
jgi:UDP-N-acetylmuramate: L-alanyl-gamma-D-glutamyl-meso-diaminopimelate ligase